MHRSLDIADSYRTLALSGLGIAVVGALVVALLQGVWGVPRSALEAPLAESATAPAAD